VAEDRARATVLGISGNYAVIQLPERKYPAAALQGDSLFALREAAKEVLSLLDSESLEDAKFSSQEVISILSGMLEFYESTCSSKKLKLPYSSS
jgi:hypothetical protein